MVEVPWFSSPPEARLTWGNHLRDDLGYLHFDDPNGRRCVVWVSKTNTVEGEEFAGQNVWHIDDNGDGTVTVSPSIHYIGHFHTPRPVVFRLVDELTGTVSDMAPDTDPAAPEYTKPHEFAAGVETDPSVLAGGPPSAVPDAPAPAAQTVPDAPPASPSTAGAPAVDAEES